MPTHSQISIRSGLLLSLRVLIANLIVALVIVAALVLVVATAAHAEGGCGAAEVEQLHNEGRTLAQEEQLREENHSTSLPDCRAYELVTPPFKDGGLAVQSVAAVGTDGSLLFSTISGFGEPGDDAAFSGTAYVATRGESGWASQPIEPLAADFRKASSAEPVEDVSSDLKRSLFLRSPVSSSEVDQRFYLDGGDGEPTEVGPSIGPALVSSYTQADAENGEFPQVRYDGASPDLSHVVFQIERGTSVTDFLWPGDETVSGESIYEYVGTGHTGLGSDTPQLIGLDSGGQQISQCGTFLASSEGGEIKDAYNAISTKASTPIPGVASEEGAIIYFTTKKGGCEARYGGGEPVIGSGPPADELYARYSEGGGVYATADISEPTAGECAACDTKEAAGPLSEEETARLLPVFEGASRDGSKAFFLSRQKLFAGKGQGVNLYEYDFRGPPGGKVTLVADDMAERQSSGGLEAGGVMRVSEDGSRVFFVSTAVLAAGNRNADGEEAVSGDDNLYVYDTNTASTAFITTLSPEDSADWAEDRREVAATPDGKYLVFASKGELTPDASGSSTQIYRYDTETGLLSRLTVGEDGLNEDGNAAALSTVLAAPTYAGAIAYAATPGVDVSEDGSQVVFASSLALTAGALDNACASQTLGGECLVPALNVYEWENGHVYLISDGRDAHPALDGGAIELYGMTPSGNDILFRTADPLVPQDTDTQADIYDARVDGGVPAPVTTPGCTGEGCQGPLAAPPSAVSPLPAPGVDENFVSSASAPKPKAKPKKKASPPCKSRKASRTSKKVSPTCKSKARKARKDRRRGR